MRLRRPTGIDRSVTTERTADGVTKYYASIERARALATKYEAVAAVGSTHFTSPVPRKVADDPPRIEFELLDAAIPIDRALTAPLREGRPGATTAVAALVGRALAVIHRNLVLPTRHQASRAPALKSALGADGLGGHPPVTPVFLHGDFGFANIALDAEGGLIVYDPEPSRYTTGAFDSVDVPEMDLATFVTCLGGRTRGVSNVRALRRHFDATSDAFLTAYAGERGDDDTGPAFDRARLAEMVIAQGAAYRSVAGWASGRSVDATAQWVARRLGRAGS